MAKSSKRKKRDSRSASVKPRGGFQSPPRGGTARRKYEHRQLTAKDYTDKDER